jgi:3-dehydroquinate synthase
VIGEDLGVTRSGSEDRIRKQLSGLGLPVEVPGRLAAAEILQLTRTDKKARQGRTEYALIERIGVASPGTGAYGTPVADDIVLKALDRCR